MILFTSDHQTEQQRERAAVNAIRHSLARLEQVADSLGRHEAAGKIQEETE